MKNIKNMKKWIGFVLLFVCTVGFAGCGKNNTYEIGIAIPAGSTETFVYADEEIAAIGKKITISAGNGLGDTEVLLSPVQETGEAEYEATYLTPGMPVILDAIDGEWYKIGISMQNDTDTDKTVSVKVEGVEIRIA